MTDLAGSPLPFAPASPAKKVNKTSSSKRASKPVSDKNKKTTDGAHVRLGLKDEVIVIDPSYRSKLRPRDREHVKEPLLPAYSSLSHHKARVLLLSKAEGLGRFSSGATRIISTSATKRAILVLRTAAAFACHQRRTMINDNDIKNAHATLNEAVKLY